MATHKPSPMLSSFLPFLLLLLSSFAHGVEVNRLAVDDVVPESHHARFTRMLVQARDQLESATDKMSTVEASQREEGFGGDGDEMGKRPNSDEMRQRAIAQMLPSAFTALSDGIAKLQHVHAEVSESDMPADVKAQVLWDLRKMMADSHRLRATSLSRPARDALVKALQVIAPQARCALRPPPPHAPSPISSRPRPSCTRAVCLHPLALIACRLAPVARSSDSASS